MSDLFEIESTSPPWVNVAQRNGIWTSFSETTGRWSAFISWFDAIETDHGATEREATVALIHRLKLAGWRTVSAG
jgi:hypothetical protein